MKLESFKVTNYKSIDDSTAIGVDPLVTCFVGKNEAGKTALLQALNGLNPIRETSYDEVKEYPRKRLREYQRLLQAGREKSATVISAVFILEEDDISAVENLYGKCVSTNSKLSIDIRYNGLKKIGLTVDEKMWCKHYTNNRELTDAVAQKAKATNSLATLITALQECPDEENVTQCLSELEEIQENSLIITIWTNALKTRVPKIFLFDDYRIMQGEANLDEIDASQSEGIRTLKELLDLAGITPQELQDSTNYEHHKAHLEAIANEITDGVFKYWKQNTALEIEFDVNRPPNNKSATFYVRIKNNKHRVTVSFDERSRGFVWFFSFLTVFKKLSEDNERMIVLLDEPGLNLHASAQADLLRFIEEKLAPNHQVIYTTHSPFMIDAQKLERVRTVEDIDSQGVKVSSECLSTDKNTVFPLQAALGYSLAQTLFLGPNCLLVEGPSDFLYLQIMSSILAADGREELNSQWVITPVGGADKIATFATLIGSNQLNICVLRDVSKKDIQRVNNLIKNNFLKQNKIVQINEFTNFSEADIEDLFEPSEYISLVKLAYPNLPQEVESDALNKRSQPRIVKRIEEHFPGKFNHFIPSQIATQKLGNSIELSIETKDRFETLFKKLNELLRNE